MRKWILIAIALIIVFIGIASACGAIFLSDPYYSLPAIPIAVLAFTTAIILFGSTLGIIKINAWLNMCVGVAVLFTCSCFAVVTYHYIIEPEKVAGRQVVGGARYDNIQHIDQDIAQIGIEAWAYNYTDSTVTIEKIVFDIYYQSGGSHEWLHAIHDQWIPGVSIESRKSTEAKYTVNIGDEEAVSNIYRRVFVQERNFPFKISGTVFFDAKGNTIEYSFYSEGVHMWYSRP